MVVNESLKPQIDNIVPSIIAGGIPGMIAVAAVVVMRMGSDQAVTCDAVFIIKLNK